MCWISVVTAAGVALPVLLKATVRVSPLAAEVMVQVPTISPPTLTTPVPPSTATFASVRIDSLSSGRPFLVNETVSEPPLKSAEFASVTVPRGAIAVAACSSV